MVGPFPNQLRHPTRTFISDTAARRLSKPALEFLSVGAIDHYAVGLGGTIWRYSL